MKKSYALETHYFPLGADVLINITYYLFLGIWSLVKVDDKTPDPRSLKIMADMSAPPPVSFLLHLFSPTLLLCGRMRGWQQFQLREKA